MVTIARLRYGLAAFAAGLFLAVTPAFAASWQYVGGSIGQNQLHTGEYGPSVRTLQGDLLGFGYSVVGRADSYFGPNTKSGLIAFQKSHGLSPSGVMDAATFRAILTEGGWGQGSSSAPSPSSSGGGSGSSSSTTTASKIPPGGKTLTLVATAYAPTAKDNYPYGPVNYFGQPLKFGDVAVDPRVIPLGTKLYVYGYHSPLLPAGGFTAVANDEGGAIKGNRLDIFINGSESQVSTFGIQTVHVKILN